MDNKETKEPLRRVDDKQGDAVTTLKTLHDVGAINLDVLVQNAPKIQANLAARGIVLEPWDICYKFTIHIGPRFADLLTVATEVEELGYRFERFQ